jgi:hypothetical protein
MEAPQKLHHLNLEPDSLGIGMIGDLNVSLLTNGGASALPFFLSLYALSVHFFEQ